MKCRTPVHIDGIDVKATLDNQREYVRFLRQDAPRQQICIDRANLGRQRSSMIQKMLNRLLKSSGNSQMQRGARVLPDLCIDTDQPHLVLKRNNDLQVLTPVHRRFHLIEITLLDRSHQGERGPGRYPGIVGVGSRLVRRPR